MEHRPPAGSGGNGAADAVAAESAVLREQLTLLQAENLRLLRLLKLSPAEAGPPAAAQSGIFHEQPGPVDAGSSATTKVALFERLFGARRDVYAVRWENVRTGRAGWMPAVRGGWRKGLRPVAADYLPLTEEVLTGF